MKRISLAAAALLAVAVGSVQAQDQGREKKNLTVEQVAKGMPDGIVNPIPTPVGWYDNSNLIVSENRELGLYNIKTGETASYQRPAPKVQPAILEELRKTVDNPMFSPDSTWVYYEEILGRATRYKAFWWSPDSKRLAYYKFDDTNVPMFPIYDAKGKHGTLNETRYPKAGDENPKVEIGMTATPRPGTRIPRWR